MKAIILNNYGTPDTLQLQDVPVPQINDDQVLVKIYAASINPIEWKIASGGMKQVFPTNFPWIPGSDFAGTVETVGKNVSSFKAGDEVYGNVAMGGGYAGYVAASPQVIAKKPNVLSFTEAASVPVVAQTAWQELFTHANLKEGQTILIHGAAGAVGGYAIQFARNAGAKVIATASGEDREFVLSIGAEKAIDYKNARFEDEAGKVDVVIDLVGGDVQQRSYAVLKEGGHLVATTQPVSADEAAKHKVTAFFMNMQPSAAGLEHIATLLDAGKLKTDVATIYPLADAAKAWQELMPNKTAGKKNKHGKAVLQVV